jgi:ribosomal protein S6
MVLVAPTVDLTGDKAQKDIIAKLVGTDATVKEVTSLGKKQLAYIIKKQSEATYLVATLEGNVKTGDVEKRSKLMDEVLRFLLIVKE